MTEQPQDHAAQLADRIAAQARTLFSHLPPDEIEADEPIEFRQDRRGRLMVRTQFCVCALIDDRVWRWRPTDDVGFLEVFHHGVLVRSATVAEKAAVGEDMARWN